MNVDLNSSYLPTVYGVSPVNHFYYAIIVNKGAFLLLMKKGEGGCAHSLKGINIFEVEGKSDSALEVYSANVKNENRAFKISDDDLSDYQISLSFLRI